MPRFMLEGPRLLFCAYTLCMNYVTKTFLLVSSSVRSKQLCFIHGQDQKSEQKNNEEICRVSKHFPSIDYAEEKEKIYLYFKCNISVPIIITSFLTLTNERMQYF